MKERVDVKPGVETVQLQLEGHSSILKMYSGWKEDDISMKGTCLQTATPEMRTQLSNFSLGNHKLQRQTAS